MDFPEVEFSVRLVDLTDAKLPVTVRKEYYRESRDGIMWNPVRGFKV